MHTFLKYNAYICKYTHTCMNLHIYTQLVRQGQVNKLCAPILVGQETLKVGMLIAEAADN